MMDRMLPEKGPWPHPYYAIDDSFVEVAFTDAEGNHRRVNVRQKRTGDGPPMVLVHGLMNSSYSWRFVLEPLGRRYRIFAPDLVGAGATDKPLDMKYSVENVARFIVAYVKTVSKEPVYLVGNSLGGLYALRALMIDESIARRFVLEHAPGYPMFRSKFVVRTLGAPLIGARLGGLVAKIAHRWPQWFVSVNVHYHRKDMLSREECVEHGRPFESFDGARVFMRIMAESIDPREHSAILEELRKRPLGIPVRIIYARKDTMVPPWMGERYHADMPGSELVWMEDASHFLHIDAPERTVEQIVQFDA
jgi:pimeloyl-ACP methyl ester carboxylesterase